MGNNGVVSIRVEGVSITIVDGNISIEQTGFAAPKVETAGTEAIPASAQRTSPQAEPDSKYMPQPAPNEAERVMPSGINPDRPPLNGSAEHHEARPRLMKPAWSNDEIEQLRALYPTHSASVIAKQLGRRVNAVKSKAQNLGLRKDAPPTVTTPRQPSPKPRSLSAAVHEESTPPPGRTGLTGLHSFGTVALIDHHPGQCRWIVSDVWPVMYCGAPVVDSSSWCREHYKRAFTRKAGERAATGDRPVRSWSW
jgi:hypothetical protein